MKKSMTWFFCTRTKKDGTLEGKCFGFTGSYNLRSDLEFLSYQTINICSSEAEAIRMMAEL